ncbi:hypothetical protein KL86DYS1_31168 [uncultured Dysgonomonas sp.]|uniref:Uncharacterized protein n=1 Tax=uncultured Dysgonomonas sp. TaxID=206096 RepID=A0A212K1T6_9BACT|nr:hypothetical protein KL86DYS1_31168 [uncultured Dysgonomonas sp.]
MQILIKSFFNIRIFWEQLQYWGVLQQLYLYKTAIPASLPPDNSLYLNLGRSIIGFHHNYSELHTNN